jgi:hypothetical protein
MAEAGEDEIMPVLCLAWHARQAKQNCREMFSGSAGVSPNAE